MSAAPGRFAAHPSRAQSAPQHRQPARLFGVRRAATIMSCLALAAGAGACGSTASQSSSASSSATASSSPSTPGSSSAAASGGRCSQLLAQSTPAVKGGPVPKLATLEANALRAQNGAFRFYGQTCVGASNPPHVVLLSGVASLHPNLVVDGHENVAGHLLEVRFIGSRIYVYLAEIASRDGGKPWLSADLKNLSSASGLNFGQLLDEIRQLSPGGRSPLLRSAAAFHAAGRAMIDGQPVYVYNGSFSPSGLTKLGLPGQLGKQTAAKLRQLGATREQITSYVTASGVARRTAVSIYKGSMLETVSINSSSRTAKPITVSPPPAAKTIAYNKVAGP